MADEVWQVADAHAPGWRRRLDEALRVAGLDPDRRPSAVLAVHEALCNAHEHGHLGDDTHVIELRLARPDRDRLVVRVVDRALGDPWSPPVSEPSATTASVAVGAERGHGLGLMRAGCDDLRIERGRGATHVVLGFDIRP